MNRKVDELSETKRLMGALVRMKPKPHEEMKVGKKTKAKKTSRTAKRHSKS
jgi:hypothetical protein